VSSFIVFALYQLDKSLSELNVFGLSLEGSDGALVVTMASVLILYWFVMYLINATKDMEINKARKHILVSKVKSFDGKLKHARERYSNHEKSHPNKEDLEKLEHEYQEYRMMLDRTRAARRLTFGSLFIEYSVPMVLAIGALMYLGSDIYIAA